MRKKLLYIISSSLIIVLSLIGAGFIYVNALLDDVIVKETVSTMANEALVDKSDNVENYALFGVDCRTENYEGCRSDVMMIVSYNKDDNQATLVSVPRDTYVEISDHGFDKINHSYAFGGPMLAVQTLNQTFDLDIRHYVAVNFSAVEAIVDALGGVEVFIEPYELGYVPDITNSGFRILNGEQALAYSRIRYVGNGDFERMERQREVIEGALDAIKTSDVTELMQLATSLIPLMRTNMPLTKMATLLGTVMVDGIPSVVKTQVPAISEGADAKIDGIYYFIPTALEDTVMGLHELIHPNTPYIPSETIATMAEQLTEFIE